MTSEFITDYCFLLKIKNNNLKEKKFRTQLF